VGFAYDTEYALAAVSALVNTAHRGVDELADEDDLDDFLTRWTWTGVRRHDRAELEGVRRLRDQMRSLWSLDEDAAVDLVNALLREAKALPFLTKHDDWDYHLHATPPEAPLADRMAVEFAMAMVDVIRQKETARLRICAADDCENVLIDLSKNRSRRFCSSACASRTNVAAFRSRRGESAQPRG
jgi:predicted RNA-binding Zn ribbon-like protein